MISVAPGTATATTATTITVTNCSGNVSSPVAGSLPAAIAQATVDNDGDTIIFTPGLSCTDAGNATDGNSQIIVTGTLDLSAPMTLDGSGATIAVSGGNAVLVMSVGSASGPIAISNLTIEDGGIKSYEGGDGGGIYIPAGTATVTLTDDTLSGNLVGGSFGGGGAIFNNGTAILADDTLNDNVGEGGGGIYNDGTATLTNDTLSGNLGGFGGGIFNDGTVTLTNDTLSGNSADFGGGIDNVGTATLTGDTLSNNSAAEGDGVDNFGTVTLTGDTLSGNSRCGTTCGDAGGALYNSSGTATLTDDTLSGNLGAAGGGVYVAGGTVTLTDDTLSGNSGGGIYTGGGTTTLTGDTLSGNSGEYGGGVLVSGGTATLTDDILSGNSAASAGGGVFINGGTATLTGDTLSNNSAAGIGGGALLNTATVTLIDDTVSNNSAINGSEVYNIGTASLIDATLFDETANGGGVYNAGTTTVTASILDQVGCTAPLIDGGYNVESDNSCGLGNTSMVNSATIDLATSLEANGSSGPQTLAIDSNSSAFEEVPASQCASLASQYAGAGSDERGDPRPGVSGASCDAGAFEYQYAAPQPVVVTVTGSQVYGSSSPVFSTATNLPPGDNFSGTLTCSTMDNPAVAITSSAPAGTSTLNGSSCSGLSITGPSASDYVLVYSGSTFTVTPAPLKVTANNEPRFYGAANPPLTATLNGFVLGQTLSNSGVSGAASCVTWASPTTNVGQYAISCTQGSLAAANYVFGPFVPGTLTINKAPTTTTAAPAVLQISPLGLPLFTLNATLSSLGKPVSGQAVTFKAGSTVLCTTTTSSTGGASCNALGSLTATLAILGANGYTVNYGGSGNYLASSGSAGLIG